MLGDGGRICFWAVLFGVCRLQAVFAKIIGTIQIVVFCVCPFPWATSTPTPLRLLPNNRRTINCLKEGSAQDREKQRVDVYL